MPFLSAEDLERLILTLLTREPLSEEDRRALILELVALRRWVRSEAARPGPDDVTYRKVGMPNGGLEGNREG